MAKIKFDPTIMGMSGKLGNVVFRQLANGETVVSARPKKSKAKPSQAQNAHRQRFKEAAAYAKSALEDPEVCVVYEKMAVGTHLTPYNIAVTDYLNGNNLLAKK